MERGKGRRHSWEEPGGNHLKGRGLGGTSIRWANGRPYEDQARRSHMKASRPVMFSFPPVGVCGMVFLRLLVPTRSIEEWCATP